MSTMIVRKIGPGPGLPSVEGWQAAFFDCRGKLCPELPSPAHTDRYLDFLAHRIARQPGDLRAHVRRILLACANGNNKLVASGLHELFCVLKHRGAGLREHLIHLCASMLDAASLESLRRIAVSPPANASVIPLVIRGASKSIPAQQPASEAVPLLAEALDYLDAGQIEEARSRLETILERFPDNAEATAILLDIYLRSRDRHAFGSLRTRLEPLPEAVRPLWETMAARLEVSA